MKSARQHLFPLRRLKRFGMGPQILKEFYSCIIECILTGCVTAWYGNCSASDQGATEGTAYGPVHHWVKLPDIRDLYIRQCQRKAQKLSKTPVTQVVDCSLCFRTESGTGVASLGPKGSLTASTPKP
jgi:hypothetical protein